MRNQFQDLTTDDLARICAASPVIFDAVQNESRVALLYFKPTTGETVRREGVPLDVFSSGSKLSVFVQQDDGEKRTFNLRNILRIKPEAAGE